MVRFDHSYHVAVDIRGAHFPQNTTSDCWCFDGRGAGYPMFGYMRTCDRGIFSRKDRSPMRKYGLGHVEIADRCCVLFGGRNKSEEILEAAKEKQNRELKGRVSADQSILAQGIKADLLGKQGRLP